VVYAIGTPQGLERTLSQGLVSAMRETSEGTVIQTSAPISPGSSGGGLFDTQGQLVGITTFQTKTGQNLNFAIPVDWLDTMRTR
jgi:S1-C subfamily serine protease